jgi:nuclear transport factor 2 (NTF2) superfamily protein
MQQLPFPPFTQVSALAKVQAAEEAWNTRDPQQVTQLCSPDCVWRNREDTFQGRAAIEYFLKSKWLIESSSRLTKELWAFTGNRISARFECEWQHATTGRWYRTHGNEHWEFDADGYMSRRDMSANDVSITANDRRIGRQFEFKTQDTRHRGRP